MTTIDDLIERNQRAGCHFFSDGAMKFFKSIVYPKVFAGDIFITSEKRRGEKRGWTVRQMDTEGFTTSLSAFQEYPNYRAAERHALCQEKIIRIQK